WYNAHNFYGDLTDLDAATLDDVQAFFKTYYAPNNAALVVSGQFDPAQTKEWIARYFESIPRATVPPLPDLSEPRQTEEKFKEVEDKLAERPALAVAYHMPPRGSPEFWAMALLNQILVEGNDSRLYQELVQKRGITGEVEGGANLLGNQFNYQGPMLWMAYLIHDKDKTPKDVVAAIDAAIEPLRSTAVDPASLDRAAVKARSAYCAALEQFNNFGRMDLLAAHALYDDDAAAVNRIEPHLLAVTPELIQKTAQEWLRPTNRTVVALKAGKAGAKWWTAPRSTRPSASPPSPWPLRRLRPCPAQRSPSSCRPSPSTSWATGSRSPSFRTGRCPRPTSRWSSGWGTSTRRPDRRAWPISLASSSSRGRAPTTRS